MFFHSFKADGEKFLFIFDSAFQKFGSLKDAVITCAAAKIAFQGGEDLFPTGIFVIQKQPQQRHHKARGAESALGAVFVQHRGLDLVQFIFSGNSFHRDQMFAMQPEGRIQA